MIVYSHPQPVASAEFIFYSFVEQYPHHQAKFAGFKDVPLSELKVSFNRKSIEQFVLRIDVKVLLRKGGKFVVRKCLGERSICATSVAKDFDFSKRYSMLCGESRKVESSPPLIG